MATDNTIQEAMEIGQLQAEKLISLRNEELQIRADVIQKMPPPEPMATPTGVSVSTMEALGPQAQDVLIAEGDSWFDYPMNDILKILEDRHGYDVESVASKGDQVEQMAYAEGQLDSFIRRIEKVLRRNIIPKAILLSGGGNDIAGSEFGLLLNHAASSIAGLNDSVVDGIINERVKIAYITIISSITQVCEQRIGRTLPILIHGYDYPVPDGRGFMGGWWFLPGPWFEPGFRAKGYSEMAIRLNLTTKLIDRFNTMLSEIAALPGFGHVQYLDLRDTLSPDADEYRDDWANELHPTKKGFRKITKEFAVRLSALP